jgi:C-terminal processing protease CtpA/Prc
MTLIKRMPVMKRRYSSAWVLLLLLVGGQAVAEDSDPNHRDAAEELADLLQAYYLFPDVGEQYASWLRSRAEQGDYDATASDSEFADSLTDGLQGISADAHLRVSVAGGAPMARRSPQRSPRKVVQNATWLSDGIAYVAITGLPESEEAEEQMARFLEEYEGADTLVLDLRFCPGGSLSVMDVLFSRLYGEPTHLLTMDMRSGAGGVIEESFMELPSLEQQDAPPGIVRWHHVARPSGNNDPWADTTVFVLADMTASACEHLTLALKRTGRATIVGAPTRGAGHFGNMRQFGDGRFEVFVPVGRTYDPQTDKGWEGGGIPPHVNVMPEKALEHVIGELGIAPDEVTLPPPPAMARMQPRESPSGGRGYGIGMVPPRGGDSHVRVMQVIEGSVAQKGGVQAGDRIVSVNGKAVPELEQGELRGIMRQSPLVLEIERDGERLGFELSLD